MHRTIRHTAAAALTLGALAVPLLAASPATALAGSGIYGGVFQSRTDATNGTRDAARDYQLKGTAARVGDI